MTRGSAGALDTDTTADPLALAASRREQRAFERIFKKYHQEIYRYCLSIVRRPEDAEDALQATMAAALRSLPGEQREIALKPWLYRVAHNESISLLRRRRPTAELDESTDPVIESAHEEAAGRERLRALVADLRTLPQRQSSALIMRELNGLDYDEIGTALDCSGAAARQTVYEARVALRGLEEGREMDCAEVRRAISDRDGRKLRGRRIKAHLAACDGCTGFRASIEQRKADLDVLCPPLPAVAAAAIASGLIGGGGGGAGGAGGLAAGGAAGAAGAGGGGLTLGGLAGAGIGGTAAIKGASVLAGAVLAAGAADATGVVDLPLPGGLGGDKARSDGGANSTLTGHGADGDRGTASASTATGGSTDAPGQAGSTPGKSEQAPGQAGTGPGKSEQAPGHGGSAPGKSSQAPGQGGSSPGNSGNAPGQTGSSPGKSGETPGHGGASPGNSGSAPGHGGSSPGNSGSAPGHGGTPPGQGATPPGQSGGSPGNSGSAPGQSGVTPPGQSGSAPGNSGSAPGQSGAAPGASGSAPGQSGSLGNSGNAPGHNK